jgi:hypothetical protein
MKIRDKLSALWIGLLLGTLAFPLALRPQNYSVGWYKVSGGGGDSSNGQYTVTGTIGQPDAGGAMTGGSFSDTGGFWALISAVQTAGLPSLAITFVGPRSVVVSWPNTGSYTLQQNPSLAAGSWTTNSAAITTANGTNSVTLTSPTGTLFFRLKQSQQ